MTMKQFLYRCEECYGSGERNLKAVIRFETCELGNTDIWDYCLCHYKLSASTKLLAQDIVDTLEDDGAVYEIIDEAIDLLIRDLSIELGQELTYCVWLASFQEVQEYYGTPTIKVDTAKGFILSDLDSEGKLFGFFQEQEEIEI